MVSKDAIIAVNDYLKIRNLNDDMKNLQPLFLSEHKDKETNTHKRVSTRAIQDFFEKYSNNTINPHMLRDYAATNMYSVSLNIVGVSKQLGHSDIKITGKRYVKPDKTSIIEALNSF